MTVTKTGKLRAADLRRIAAQAEEPERERKMLALAEQLDEEGPGRSEPNGGNTSPYTRKGRR
jgi:hypothetical protein